MRTAVTRSGATLTVGVDGSPANEVENADFVFVREGTVNGSSGWYVLTTGTITVDTTAIEFDQFSGAGSIPDATSASGGGVKGKVTFDSDTGLSVTSGVARIALGTPPGLEFDSVNGRLQALADPNGGLEVVAAGNKVKLNGTTLALAAGGASVLGVPAGGTWEIGGAATGANVSAANLTELTGAGYTMLHKHLSALTQINADAGGVTKGDPLFPSGADVVGDADASVGAQARGFCGVANNTAAGAAAVDVANDGNIVTGVLVGATANDLVYMAVGGGLTTTAPGSGNFRVIVGKAINATDMVVYAQYLGKAA